MKKLALRALTFIPAVALQIVWIYILIRWLAPYAAIINTITAIASIVFVLYIIDNHIESIYKTLWIIIILGFPIFGAVFYVAFGNKRSARPLANRLKRNPLPEMLDEESTQALLEPVKLRDPHIAQTLSYIEHLSGFPLTTYDDAHYFDIGEKLFQQMLIDLENARESIYVEYFIIDHGVMWDSMVEIMARKAAQGVDVRVMYDDMGSLSTYSADDVADLRRLGIQCIAFNPLIFVSPTLNYRDHRKMLIIDERVAFTGGINLADEYINVTQKYGHWKDTGVRLTGRAVASYTAMFVQFWNAFAPTPLTPHGQDNDSAQDSDGGLVLSYYNSPLTDTSTSNALYVELLSSATGYAWFFTPYLMLGDTLMDAFIRAAQRGVDVHIIVPGIPDKKIIYRITRSYYEPLLKAGVKIFEYTPGFVHAKGCVVDDKIATVGTVNLDYRSLYLNFENNAVFYHASLIPDIKNDFLTTQEKCRERVLGDTKRNLGTWFMDSILRLIAPLS